MIKPKISKVYFSLTHWHDFRLKLFGEGILVSFLVGLIIVAFRYSIEKIEMVSTVIYRNMHPENWIFTLLWFLGLCVIAYILNWIVKVEPMAAGSGIPQVKAVLFTKR